MQMVFKPRPGFRFRTSAEVVGARLEAMKAAAGGRLAPESVVEEGLSPDSPIHPEFRDVLDDAECGRRLRIHRAESLLNCYIRVVHDDDGRQEEVLGNVRVVEREETADGETAYRRTYMSPELAFRLPGQRERIFAEVERGLVGWQERLRLMRLAESADLRLFDRCRAMFRRRAGAKKKEAAARA